MALAIIRRNPVAMLLLGRIGGVQQLAASFLPIASHPVAPRVSAFNSVPFWPNLAFDPGHVPVRDPLSRRHHSTDPPPLIARLGRCRSMLALGSIGAPTHRSGNVMKGFSVVLTLVTNKYFYSHRGGSVMKKPTFPLAVGIFAWLASSSWVAQAQVIKKMIINTPVHIGP